MTREAPTWTKNDQNPFFRPWRIDLRCIVISDQRRKSQQNQIIDQIQTRIESERESWSCQRTNREENSPITKFSVKGKSRKQFRFSEGRLPLCRGKYLICKIIPNQEWPGGTKTKPCSTNLEKIAMWPKIDAALFYIEQDKIGQYRLEKFVVEENFWKCTSFTGKISTDHPGEVRYRIMNVVVVVLGLWFVNLYFSDWTLRPWSTEMHF